MRDQKFNKNKKVAPKREIVEKRFSKTVYSLDSMIKELSNAHDEIRYALIVEDEEITSLRQLMENLLGYIMYKCPDIENMENLRTSISLKPNKVYVQTNANIGFSWSIRYDRSRDRKSATITEITLGITLIGQKSIDLNEEFLLQNEWIESIHETK